MEEKFSYQNLPEPIWQHLTSIELSEKLFKILEENKIEIEKLDALLAEIDAIVFKQKIISQFPKSLEGALAISAELSRKLALAIAGNCLLPIEAYLGGVANAIVSWGGKIENFPKSRVEIKKIKADDFVNEVYKNLNLKIPDLFEDKRLRSMISLFVSGARDEEETVSAMTRDKAIGGLETNEKVAHDLIEKIAKLKMGVVILNEDEALGESAVLGAGGIAQKSAATPTASPQAPAPAPKQVFAPVAEATKSSHDFTMDFEEIALQGNKLLSEAENQKMEEFVKNFIGSSGIKFDSDEDKTRFAKIVGNRLRGVRDAYETAEILEKPKDKGGLGISGERLAKISALIEKADKEYHAKEVLRASTAREEYVKNRAETLATRETRISEKEKMDRDDLFAKLTGVAAQTPASTRAFAPPPPPIAPKFSQESIITAPSAHPKISDVVYAKKLAGPIEELSQMRLVDWRRLSSDSKEAAIKIKDKIDLLGSESYGKKISGINAWKSSPIYRLYLEIVKQALIEGKSISNVILARQNAGIESISENEAKAIIELNKDIKI